MTRERKGGNQAKKGAAKRRVSTAAPRLITTISIHGLGNVTITAHDGAIVTIYQNWPEGAAAQARENGGNENGD
jgi:hypothetical protein